ncbi:MAG TPA: hypothetical protein VF540_00305 [Segetibacter sp.]|jgi:hypothetical protein
MELQERISTGKTRKVSEVTILIFSFVTALVAAIIIISAVFLTVKRIENKLAKAFDVSYLACR